MTTATLNLQDAGIIGRGDNSGIIMLSWTSRRVPGRPAETPSAACATRPRAESLVRVVQLRSQSWWRRGWFVGRRSLVSTSSALCASSWRASPSARATRSATSQVGLATPRSRPRTEVASRSAASARASCVSPISSRRRRIARPRATWGVWLICTLEPSAEKAPMTREQVPGRLYRAPCRSNAHSSPDLGRLPVPSGMGFQMRPAIRMSGMFGHLVRYPAVMATPPRHVRSGAPSETADIAGAGPSIAAPVSPPPPPPP